MRMRLGVVQLSPRLCGKPRIRLPACPAVQRLVQNRRIRITLVPMIAASRGHGVELTRPTPASLSEWLSRGVARCRARASAQSGGR
jgi:hypothetical protein